MIHAVPENPWIEREGLTSYYPEVCKECFIAFLTIGVIGCLIAEVIGISSLGVQQGWWSAGALSNLSQFQNALTAAALGGGMILILIPVIVSAVKRCRQPENSLDVNRTEFIERARSGNIRGDIHFGKAKWEEVFFGTECDEPAISTELSECLNSPCPFSHDETILTKDTHMLVLMPPSVGEESLSVSRMYSYVREHQNQEGNSSFSSTLSNDDEINNIRIDRPYWALVARHVIPGSRNQTFAQQQALVEQYGYKMLDPLEATVCSYAEFVSSGMLFANRGGALFDPETYIGCKHQINGRGYIFKCVSEGLTISDGMFCGRGEHLGTSAIRRFY